jgi:hypothetical protein
MPWRRVHCLIKHHAMKTYGGIDAVHIVNPGTRWRWVVRFTPPPLYPQGKSPRYPSDGGIGGPQNQFGRGGEK